jgi:hypothetical protein
MDWLERFEWEERSGDHHAWENGYGDVLRLDDRLADTGQTTLSDFEEPRYELEVTSEKSSYRRSLKEEFYSHRTAGQYVEELVGED